MEVECIAWGRSMVSLCLHGRHLAASQGILLCLSLTPRPGIPPLKLLHLHFQNLISSCPPHHRRFGKKQVERDRSREWQPIWSTFPLLPIASSTAVPSTLSFSLSLSLTHTHTQIHTRTSDTIVVVHCIPKLRVVMPNSPNSGKYINNEAEMTLILIIAISIFAIWIFFFSVGSDSLRKWLALAFLIFLM